MRTQYIAEFHRLAQGGYLQETLAEEEGKPAVPPHVVSQQSHAYSKGEWARNATRKLSKAPAGGTSSDHYHAHKDHEYAASQFRELHDMAKRNGHEDIAGKAVKEAGYHGRKATHHHAQWKEKSAASSAAWYGSPEGKAAQRHIKGEGVEHFKAPADTDARRAKLKQQSKNALALSKQAHRSGAWNDHEKAANAHYGAWSEHEHYSKFAAKHVGAAVAHEHALIARNHEKQYDAHNRARGIKD